MYAAKDTKGKMDLPVCLNKYLTIKIYRPMPSKRHTIVFQPVKVLE